MNAKRHFLAAAAAAALALAPSLAFGADGPVSVAVSVTAEKLPPNADFTFTVTVEGTGMRSLPEPARPDFGPIQVTGQSSAQSVSIVNMSMKISKTVSYYAVAPKAGTYTIPPVTVEYEGKTYSSKSVTITVDPAAKSAPPPSRAGGQGIFNHPFFNDPFAGRDARRQDDEDLFAEMELDKTKLWVGEQAVATFSFWRGIQLWEKPNYKKPKFEGFWVEDIPFERGKDEQTTIETKNGRDYAVSRIRYALVPLAPGKLTVDSAVVTASVDPWTRNKQIFTEPLEVTAAALPSQGKPAGFTGLVTTSPKISLKAGSLRVRAGESLSLILRIEGPGYFKSAGAPPPPKGEWLDTFDPKTSEEMDKSSGRLYTKRTVEYPFIARKEGSWTLPPITVAWFDPSTGKYETQDLTVEPVTVEKGVAALSPQSPTLQGGEAFPDKPRYIKPDRESLPDYGAADPAQPWLFIIIIGPVLLLAAAWMRRRRMDRLEKDEALKRSVNAAKTARGKLAHAAALTDPAEFYAALDAAIRGYLADKSGRPAPSITRETAQELLKGVSGGLGERMVKLLASVEMSRYARPAGDQMKQTLDQASELIAEMEKEMRP